MSLETMRPNPTWDAASYEEAVETLAAYNDDVVYKIWGGDWCKDCRALLPDFGAALEAAAVPDERIEESSLDQDKQGPASTSTISSTFRRSWSRNDEGEEITRFVEEEDVPPAVWLAEEIETAPESA